MKINKTAARVIDIIQLLAKSKKPLTQLEISQHLDIPKSSTFDLIYTLLDKKIVEFDNVDLKTFKLSLNVFEIGTSVITKTNLISTSHNEMKNLSEQTDKTIFLAIESNGDIIYIHRVENQPSIINSVNLGTRLPMYCTALGKALLSTYDENKIKEIWFSKENKTSYTKHTIKTYDELYTELLETKSRGYALDNHELNNDSCCIAAPIFCYNSNEAIAAISLGFVCNNLSEEIISKYAPLIMNTAKKISYNMGYLL